jgi:hypothetical protein
MSAKIVKVEYYLPETVITNNDLAKEFPEWCRFSSFLYSKPGILPAYKRLCFTK